MRHWFGSNTAELLNQVNIYFLQKMPSNQAICAKRIICLDITNTFQRKIVNIFLPIIISICLGAIKVLLSFSDTVCNSFVQKLMLVRVAKCSSFVCQESKTS